jgi:hypothetical protein
MTPSQWRPRSKERLPNPWFVVWDVGLNPDVLSWKSNPKRVETIKSDDMSEIYTIRFYTMETMVILGSIDGGERIWV